MACRAPKSNRIRQTRQHARPILTRAKGGIRKIYAEMPGWVRFKPAAEWLAAHRSQTASAKPDSTLGQSSPELKAAFEKFMQNDVSSPGRNTLSTKEREMLFARFMKFLAESKAEQAAAR